jgi:hypothetical protein
VAVLAMILTSGIGLAALVGYISNTITADVTVQSPMKLLISKTMDSGYVDTSITLGIIKGGESVEFYTLTQNLASVATSGTSWNVVSNPLGVTCNDFTITNVMTRSRTPIGGIWPVSWTDTTTGYGLVCGTIDAYNVRIKVSPTEPWSWPANYEDNMHFTIKFATAASGTYTLTSTIIP